MKERYMSYTPDNGVDLHDTEAEARAEVEAWVDHHRDGQWPEDVEDAYWGIVLGGVEEEPGARKSAEQQADELGLSPEEAADFIHRREYDYITDYRVTRWVVDAAPAVDLRDRWEDRTPAAQLAPDVLAQIDPLIRGLVVDLRLLGWDTCDSGGGSSDPTCVVMPPHVAVQIDRAQYDALPGALEVLAEHARERGERHGLLLTDATVTISIRREEPVAILCTFERADAEGAARSSEPPPDDGEPSPATLAAYDADLLRESLAQTSAALVTALAENGHDRARELENELSYARVQLGGAEVKLARIREAIPDDSWDPEAPEDLTAAVWFLRSTAARATEDLAGERAYIKQMRDEIDAAKAAIPEGVHMHTRTGAPLAELIKNLISLNAAFPEEARRAAAEGGS